jgi:hypothetical protein
VRQHTLESHTLLFHSKYFVFQFAIKILILKSTELQFCPFLCMSVKFGLLHSGRNINGRRSKISEDGIYAGKRGGNREVRRLHKKKLCDLHSSPYYIQANK